MRSLEMIGDRDESLYDTVVREAMGDPIFHLFIKPTPGYNLPDDYGMQDNDNLVIKAILRDYTTKASDLAASLGLRTFHQRLAAFQNGDIATERKNYFDDFFGWSNPDWFDHTGNVIFRK